MKKFLKWLLYIGGLITVLAIIVLTVAYWNRDQLLDKLTTQLNKGINGKFSIEKIDFTFLHNFPNFSITLHRVSLRDNQYEQYQKELISAKKVVLDVNPYALMKKEIKINSLAVDAANVFIFKAANGDTNIDVFKKQDSVQTENGEKSSLFLNLEKINFKNVSVVYADSGKRKFINFQFQNTRQTFSQTDSVYTININGEMHFDSLYFNPKGGSYLADKDALVNLNFRINRITNNLTIQPSSLTYQKNQIDLSGKFQLQKEGTYSLLFTSHNINPTEATQLLNKKLMRSLSKFKMKDPVDIEVRLAGRSIPGYVPDVDVEFETKNAKFQYRELDFSSLSLKGLFTNHLDSLKPKDNNNSKVTITSFEATMEKIPVKGKVIFTQLQDPTIDLSFSSKMSFRDVNKHLDNNRFLLEKGRFETAVTYQGKLSEYLDPTRTKYMGKLKGQIQAMNASLRYKPKKIHLDNIQLTCTFNEDVFTIRDLNLRVNGSAVSMHGNIKDFIPFFIQPKNKGYVRLSVSSPGFDLTSLTSRRDMGKKSNEKNRENRKKLTELIDKVYDKLEFDVDVGIDQLKFRKFSGSNFKGRVKLDNSLLQANPVSMQVAGGTMNLNFSLSNVFDSFSPMAVEAQLNNANIKELFQHFNNFNQKTITAENLEGKISADVDFSATVDDNYKLVPSSMRGTLDCKISEGGLKNFEPMENMSNFLFKKRDFSDVQFAELNSAFSIEGTNMDISRMEIQSSVLSLFLEGRYSFTDSTSLSVQIPLSNLKKRHKDFTPKNIGIHAKAGPSVYLHVYRDKDINSKIQIDYDPFKKWARN